MAHKHDTHFIPSPFKVVTQYENAFVRAWNNNMAEAVAEVLKYIANATAVAIKTGQVGGTSILDEIDDAEVEKAHQVGDLHPNGKWVWTEYKPGKFDWRIANKKKKVTQKIWEINPEIAKLKTSAECQKYVEDKGYISWASDIKKADLKSAQLICSALVNLHDLIPYQRIKIKMARLKDAIMDASDGETIRINSDYFTAFNPSKYWHRTNDKYVIRNKQALENTEKQIKQALAANPNTDVSKLVQLKDKLAEKIAKCPRWTYGDEATLAADIVLHEMGHILNAQCSGGCGHWKNPMYKLSHTPDEIKKHQQLNDERNTIFQRYCKEKRVLSEYSTTKPAEFFAECFVAWVHKDKALPKYVSDFYDKYFKETTPKR